jgi:8-oxo-dGTP diphosphatase
LVGSVVFRDLILMVKKGKYVYDWPRPMVAADAAVFGFFEGKVKLLLVNRKNEPFRGKWALPGGFVDIDEEVEDAVARELEEETGLVGVALEQIYTFSKCGRDPRGRVFTVTFIGFVTEEWRKVKAGDDAAKARWFDIGKLPRDMAFDHDEVTRFAIRKLKRRKIYREWIGQPGRRASRPAKMR